VWCGEYFIITLLEIYHQICQRNK